MNFIEYWRRIRIRNQSHFFSDFINYQSLPEPIKTYNRIPALGRKLSLRRGGIMFPKMKKLQETEQEAWNNVLRCLKDLDERIKSLETKLAE